MSRGSLRLRRAHTRSASITSPRFPEPAAAIPPTPISELDAIVDRLPANKAAWVATSIPERIALLEKCRVGVESAAEPGFAICAA